MSRLWRHPAVSRRGLAILLFVSVILLYAWSVARNLQDLSLRLATTAVPAEPAPPENVTSIAVQFDQIGEQTQDWFGPASVPDLEVIRVESPRRPIVKPDAVDPPISSEPVVSVAAEFPVMKLSGVFIGERIRQALVESDGTRQIIALGQDVHGWRLVDLERSAAVFESAAGERHSMYLYPQ